MERPLPRWQKKWIWVKTPSIHTSKLSIPPWKSIPGRWRSKRPLSKNGCPDPKKHFFFWLFFQNSPEQVRSPPTIPYTFRPTRTSYTVQKGTKEWFDITGGPKRPSWACITPKFIGLTRNFLPPCVQPDQRWVSIWAVYLSCKIKLAGFAPKQNAATKFRVNASWMFFSKNDVSPLNL